jgi:hypothetical protein
VEVRQCEKEARPGSRFDRAVQRDILTLVEHSGDRLSPTGGNTPPHHRQSAEPGLVLGKDFDQADRRVAFELRAEEGRQGGLKPCHCL